MNGELYAEANDDTEARSLEALATTTRALAIQSTGATLPKSDRPLQGAVHCPTCAAPIALTDEAQVACSFCSTWSSSPTRRARSSRRAPRWSTNAASPSACSAASSANRGARTTNALLVLSIPAAPRGLAHCRRGVRRALPDAPRLRARRRRRALRRRARRSPTALSWLVRAQIAGRAAIRIVSSRFAAVPPDVAGDPPSCRECGAQLAHTSAEQLIAICIYCASENVLGVNLLPSATRESHQAKDLATELRERPPRAAAPPLHLAGISRAPRPRRLSSLGPLALGHDRRGAHGARTLDERALCYRWPEWCCDLPPPCPPCVR